MTGEDVTELYRALEAAGVRIWIDGGWGVDAVLGRQTRPHGDLDVALEQKDLPAFRALMAARGYADHPRPDTTAWNFVLADAAGRQIDAHVVVLDTEGNGVLGPPENGHVYPAGALTGEGVIDGVTVRCVAAAFAVRFHTGYPPRDSDLADVRALCAAFGIAPPEGFAPWPAPPSSAA